MSHRTRSWRECRRGRSGSGPEGVVRPTGQPPYPSSPRVGLPLPLREGPDLIGPDVLVGLGSASEVDLSPALADTELDQPCQVQLTRREGVELPLVGRLVPVEHALMEEAEVPGD